MNFEDDIKWTWWNPYRDNSDWKEWSLQVESDGWARLRELPSCNWFATIVNKLTPLYPSKSRGKFQCSQLCAMTYESTKTRVRNITLFWPKRLDIKGISNITCIWYSDKQKISLEVRTSPTFLLFQAFPTLGKCGKIYLLKDPTNSNPHFLLPENWEWGNWDSYTTWTTRTEESWCTWVKTNFWPRYHN